MKRKVFIYGSALILLAVAVVASVFAAGATGQDPSYAQEKSVTDALTTAGLDGVEAKAADGTLNLRFQYPTPQPATAIEDAVLSAYVYRVAAEQGFERMALTVEMDGKEVQENAVLSPLDIREYLPADKAQAEIAAWVEEIKRATGVEASWTLKDHRLDIKTEGSVDAVRTAAERFMNGGVVQHEHGSLDLLTVAATVGGKTVFEGVYDYQVGQAIRAFEAKGFGLEF